MMKQKLDYMSERQRVLAQNIANANTPGYKTQDVEMNFEGLLQAKKSNSVSLAATHPNHIRSNISGATSFKTIEAESSETTPNGNNVVIEEELLKMQKNNMDYQTTADLYKKMAGMIRTAIGDGR